MPRRSAAAAPREPVPPARRPERGPHRRALPRVAAVLVAMSLGTSSAHAAPGKQPDPDLAAATRTYEEGISERDAGNFVAAAESFTAAYRAIPMQERGIRASVLFDLVDARRNAFAEGEGPGQLCECERVVVAYLDELKQGFGSKAEKFPDTRKARKLLAELRKQVDELRVENPALDCATTPLEKPAPPEPEPAPEPTPPPTTTPTPDLDAHQADAANARRARTLTIAGAVTTGVGGLFLGMLTAGLVLGRNADRDGQARTQAAIAAGTPLSQDDPGLQSLVHRGKLGNGLAIAGGVLATVAVATGVSLLVLGQRARKAPPRAALAPALAPGFTGATLVLRF